MNYYFYLTPFTMGEIWAINVLFVLGFLCCVVWSIFYLFFLENNNRVQIIVFGRFGSPEKGWLVWLGG